MKNLFDPILVEDTKKRILQLRPESERQWGSMAAAETLAHCTSGVEMAMGVIETEAITISRQHDWRAYQAVGLSRRQADAPQLALIAGAVPNEPSRCDFEGERSRLIASIESFARQGAAGCTCRPHPFFGPLTPQQWAILMYKHIDHHLRQFGA